MEIRKKWINAQPLSLFLLQCKRSSLNWCQDCLRWLHKLFSRQLAVNEHSENRIRLIKRNRHFNSLGTSFLLSFVLSPSVTCFENILLVLVFLVMSQKHKTILTFIEAKLCFLFPNNLRVKREPGPGPVHHFPSARDHSKSWCMIIWDASKIKIQPKSSKKLNTQKVLSFPRRFLHWTYLTLSPLLQTKISPVF